MSKQSDSSHQLDNAPEIKEAKNALTDFEEMAAVAAEIEGEENAAFEEVRQVEIQETAAAAIETVELLQAVIKPTADILAPNWKITDEESAALAGAYGPLLDKYFPDVASDAGPEITAALVTVAILGSRAGMPRKLPPVEPKQEGADNGADT